VRKATEMPFNLILEAVPGAGALDPPRQALGRFRCRALALIGDARTAIQTSDSLLATTTLPICNDPFTSARVLAGMRKQRPFPTAWRTGKIDPKLPFEVGHTTGRNALHWVVAQPGAVYSPTASRALV
jgi:hypothetical protein